MKRDYKTADFDFDLPADLIAQRPASPRDAARMLVVGEQFVDRQMRDLPLELAPGDRLVVNNTRVIPARLFGLRGPGTTEKGGNQRGTVQIEILLHRRRQDGAWLSFCRPAKRLRVGDWIALEEGEDAPGFQVLEKLESGEVCLQFQSDRMDEAQALETYGDMPLPPYITRERGLGAETDTRDRDDYQTMFAAREGAVAAPTAGLHFTPQLLESLATRGVETTEITLHVGAGTFLPVKVEKIADHKMHAEYGEISPEAAGEINRTRAAGGRIVAVGTTSLRLMESASSDDGTMKPWHGDTDIFITPGYQFRAVDLLVTNFHLPQSTLFMLVCAFAGFERIHSAYDHAIRQGYRFYSFGDGSLLTRA